MDKRTKELMADRQGLVPQCFADTATLAGICSRADAEQELCNVYAYPAAKWRNGDCPMADNSLRTDTAPKTKTKIRVGQQKQRKR